MGSTQMLLIVLGVIIVGIAIVVGTLPNFVKGMNNSNKDALTQDCLKLAAAAQGYFRRPTLFRGGGNSFTNINIKDLGMADAGGGRAENANGEFSVDGSDGATCVITGYSNTVDNATITVTVHPGFVENPIFEGW
jgi:hypothetical protein